MTIVVAEVRDRATKSQLCTEIITELPMSFGRPEANARYVRDIADRDAFGASVDGQVLGLIALEVHFSSTCNIWWLGIRPLAHRHGLGRALVEKSVDFARIRNCKRMAVETMSPRDDSAEYAVARHFYAAMGFVPFVEFEPSPGDWMMWMLREL
ncbi:MAG: GNAT family N-acetyltransferase [Hyphomicrobiaceae bacterium]